MCRPCTAIDEKAVQPQELVDVVTRNGVSPQDLPSIHSSVRDLVIPVM